MVAPSDEVADEEIQIDDDGEGARDARAEPSVDEPEMTHHHHHHEKYDQEQKLCANTI